MSDVVVGSLHIDLIANTASFQTDMGKAADVSKKSANDIKDSFDKIGKSATYSMGEAKGGLMLFEEAIGVRLPRHLNALIAQIPGVGALFANMLPIIGVIAAIAVVATLIEHHEKLLEAQRKMAEEVANLTIKERDRTEGLELENLKIEDQIAKLEGRPSKNRLAEVLLEAKIKADNLAASLGDVQKKSEEAVEGALGFWGRLKREFGSVHDAAQTVLSKLDKITAGNSSDSSRYVTDVTKINDELRNMGEAYNKVQQARDALSEAKGGEGEAAAILALGAAYKNYEESATSAGVVVRSLDHDNFNLRQRIDEAKISAHSGAESMSLDAKNLALSTKLAEEQTAKDVADAQLRVTEAHISADKLIRDAHTQRIVAEQALDNAASMADIDLAIQRAKESITFDQNLFEQKKALLQKETDEKVAAADAQYSHDSEALSKKLALVKGEMGDHKAEIITLDAQIKVLAEKHEGELSRIHKQGVQEQAAVDRAATADEAAELQKRAQMTNAAAAEQVSFEISMAKEQLKVDQKLAADRVAMHKANRDQALKDLVDAENREFTTEQKALQNEIASLDAHDKQYEEKVKAANHKLEELTKQHEDKITEIKANAEKDRAKKIEQAEGQMGKAIAQTAIQSLVHATSLADGMKKLGQQMLEDALTKMAEHLAMKEMYKIKEDLMDASRAAKSAFRWVMEDVPFPANAVLAPVAAAAAFGGVMAFEQGGLVPETAMALVHKNEMVLPADLASGMQAMIKSGSHMVSPYVDSASGAGDTHYHNHIDARGADAGVEARVHRALRESEQRAVSRSIAAQQDRAARRK